MLISISRTFCHCVQHQKAGGFLCVFKNFHPFKSATRINISSGFYRYLCYLYKSDTSLSLVSIAYGETMGLSSWKLLKQVICGGVDKPIHVSASNSVHFPPFHHLHANKLTTKGCVHVPWPKEEYPYREMPEQETKKWESSKESSKGKCSLALLLFMGFPH